MSTNDETPSCLPAPLSEEERGALKLRLELALQRVNELERVWMPQAMTGNPKAARVVTDLLGLEVTLLGIRVR